MALMPNWKMRSKLLRTFLLAVLLPPLVTSCATSGTAPTPVLTLPDEACLQEAEPLPPLLEPSLAAAIRNHVEVADLYWQLAARHRCLAQFERGRR